MSSTLRSLRTKRVLASIASSEKLWTGLPCTAQMRQGTLWIVATGLGYLLTLDISHVRLDWFSSTACYLGFRWFVHTFLKLCAHVARAFRSQQFLFHFNRKEIFNLSVWFLICALRSTLQKFEVFRSKKRVAFVNIANFYMFAMYLQCGSGSTISISEKRHWWATSQLLSVPWFFALWTEATRALEQSGSQP